MLLNCLQRFRITKVVFWFCNFSFYKTNKISIKKHSILLNATILVMHCACCTIQHKFSEKDCEQGQIFVLSWYARQERISRKVVR